MARVDILERKEEILQWIEQNQSKAFICQQLMCKPETLNSYLGKMGISYSGNKGGKGIKHASNYKTAAEYAQGTSVKSHILKLKLLRDGVKEHGCELCKMTIWLDQPIPLELHHKDGNHFNNELSNLMMLCPNCHALQEGNSGANIGAYDKQQAYIHGTTVPTKEQHPCPQCGKLCGTDTKTGMCKSCAAKASTSRIRVVAQENRPSKEELKNLIRTKSFLEIGRIYGVSDNAIRKWCVAEKLPSTKKEINQYSNEDWENI